jgi:hypothetical protein
MGDPMRILMTLLRALRERQSFCPLCGGEYVCDSGCALDGVWFEPRPASPSSDTEAGR